MSRALVKCECVVTLQSPMFVSYHSGVLRYYEGKEFETQLKHKRPGDLSPELVEALSIPPLAPPPWLISMQRFGPPPSYPTLRIPGLNAPIPEGCVRYILCNMPQKLIRYRSFRAQWGFHPGGWGKPPLDEYNRPLYGDVFGVLPKNTDSNVRLICCGCPTTSADPCLQAGEPIDRNAWGELEPEEGMCAAVVFRSRHSNFPRDATEESESESESEEEEEEVAEPAPSDGLQTPSGLETPSGMASVVSTIAGGLETPDFLELRKNSARAQSEVSDAGPRSLYQVVPEKQTSVRGLMGSERGYDVTAVTSGGGAIPVLGDERGTKVR